MSVSEPESVGAASSVLAIPTAESMSKDELLIVNRRLQQENEWLRSQLIKLETDALAGGARAAASSRDTDGNDASSIAAEREAELRTYANQLRVEGATIIRQNEELLALRQRCAFYATAISETSANFEELKSLLATLDQTGNV